MDADTPLEPSPEVMRRMIDHATARVLSQVESLREPPMDATAEGEAAALAFREPMPETGAAFDALLDTLFQDAFPHSLKTSGPGFFGYVPGGGIFTSAIADLLADVANRYVTVRAAAPVLSEIESVVVHWFAELIGYDTETAGGYLASGGSLANFSAVVTARHEKLPENFLAGTLYASDQAHHSVTKAALLAGFPARNVRVVPSDGAQRMRVDALREMIAEDRAAGLQPFLVVGSAGTTNTGAVDPLPAIADVAREEDLWFHADAAYGGFFLLTDAGREALTGIDRADSVTLDPHKGLAIPFGTGALVVRDPHALKRAHSLRGEYMTHAVESTFELNASDVSPELSRSFRGLRVWLPLKLHGADAFRSMLAEKLTLARECADALRDVPDVRVVAEPQLSALAFRLEPDGVTGDALDALNRELMQRVNRKGRAYISGTVLDERFTPRVCVLNFRTHREHVNALVEDVREAAAALTQGEA